MALRNPFKFAMELVANGGRATTTASGRAVRSPWSGTTLSRIAWSDVFGETPAIPTRAEAMRVPAIAKGRSLIVGTLARQTLAKFRGADKLAPDAWMYRTNTDVPPQTRMAWTLDDVIFGGVSLWAVERGKGDQITDGVRVPPEWWEVTPDLEVLVNGCPVSEGEVLLFEGPQEGLLELAQDDIVAARDMTRAWANRVSAPVPLVELHETSGIELEDEEADELIDTWETARRRGGTALTPSNIETKIHGTTPTDLFVNGRNASRLDIANFLNLPASLLEGSSAVASLTYSTSTDDRNELVDLSLAYWATPLEARLSQDDVVPRGTRVAFDLEYLATPTQPLQGPASED